MTNKLISQIGADKTNFTLAAADHLKASGAKFRRF